MKILVCGKGGCGKSTVSSLLAREYESRGKKVLVIDSDESNFGLHRQLGIDLPEDFINYYGGRKGMWELEKLFNSKWGLKDIPEGYVNSDGNVTLLAVGKIHDAGEGCACAMGSLSREFLENLELSDDEVAICDCEAGIEHFGRGVDANADVILMIVDPSYESVMLSEKIYNMGQKIHRPVYYVINKADETQAEYLRSTLAHPDVILGVLPASDEIMKAGMTGEPLRMKTEAVSDIADNI